MTAWHRWQSLSGHRFHDAVGKPDTAYCARCGTAVADFRHDYSALMRTRCRPYQEPRLLRLLRWLAR